MHPLAAIDRAAQLVEVAAVLELLGALGVAVGVAAHDPRAGCKSRQVSG